MEAKLNRTYDIEVTRTWEEVIINDYFLFGMGLDSCKSVEKPCNLAIIQQSDER